MFWAREGECGVSCGALPSGGRSCGVRAHLGAVDDDDLDVEGGDERRELGEGGDRHPDHRRLLERGELELRVQSRLQTEGKRVSIV